MELRERITVCAVFSAGAVRPVRPVWFAWRGRKYSVAEVTYTWESREGMTRFRHFAVVCGANVYALAFDPAEQGWEIRGVEQDWRG